MISDGRYGYHKADIAELEAKPALGPVEQFNLERMRREVAEYEKAHGIPSTLKPTSPALHTHTAVLSPLPDFKDGRIAPGTRCKHGNENFCGFCAVGSDPS